MDAPFAWLFHPTTPMTPVLTAIALLLTEATKSGLS